MGFSRGDLMEVASKEDGFEGSYFSAIVISELLRKEFIIQYNTLVKDDLSEPLREIVDAGELRPVPPKIHATAFCMGDKVDAYDLDGWWVGKISGRVGSKYFVYFDTTGDEIGYPVNKLRVHQDWANDKWVLSKNKANN